MCACGVHMSFIFIVSSATCHLRTDINARWDVSFLKFVGIFKMRDFGGFLKCVK